MSSLFDRLDPRPWHAVTVLFGPRGLAAAKGWAQARAMPLARVEPGAGADPGHLLRPLVGALRAAGVELDRGLAAVLAEAPPLDAFLTLVVLPALAAAPPLSLAVADLPGFGPGARHGLRFLIDNLPSQHRIFLLGDDRALLAGIPDDRVDRVRLDVLAGAEALDGAGAGETAAMPVIAPMAAAALPEPLRVARARLRRGDAALAAALAAAVDHPAAAVIAAEAWLALDALDPLVALAARAPDAAPLAVAARALHGLVEPAALDAAIAALHAAGQGWTTVAGRLRLARAKVAWRQGALASAVEDAEAARLRGLLLHDAGLAVEAAAHAARARAADGDRDGAIGALCLAEQAAGAWPTPRIDEIVTAAFARVAALVDAPQPRRASRLDAETRDARWAAALARLAREPAVVRRHALGERGEPALRLPWALLAAVAGWTMGERGAVDALRAAVEGCLAHGLRSPFIELGPHLAPRIGKLPADLQATLARVRLGPAPRSRLHARPAFELRRRLSPREVEAVRLAARGLSNRQIGLELGIATSTAGLHLRHAYTKLGAPGRRTALRRARALGIIDGS